MGPIGHKIRPQIRNDLVYLASLGLVLAAVPLVGLLIFAGRIIFLMGLALVALGAVAVTVSPVLRRWWESRSAGQVSFSGIRLAHDVALHPAHAWARVERGRLVVGADDLIQATLGPLDEVDVPPPGREVVRGEPLFRLQRDGRRVDVLSPVNGSVESCNAALRERPELVNEAPFTAGWVVRLDGRFPRWQLRTLLRGEKARAWMRAEVDRLLASHWWAGLVAEPGGAVPSVPDGGVMVGDVYRYIDEISWERINRGFFGVRAHGAP